MVHLHVLFNINPVYARTGHLLYTTLDERILFEGKGKGKGMSFPRPVTAIFQMLGVLVTRKRITPAARRKNGR
jgi:hypothetical protein